MKRIIVGTIALMMAMPSFADDTPATGDKRITSKNYVDTSVATKQNKIPAANTSGVGAGTSVITYTNVAGGGVIGERALFTGGEYTAGTDADKLITGSALNGAITSIPTTPTTTLECANQSGGCTLWTIIDQTAYGVSGDGTTTGDLMALIGNVTGVQIAYINPDGGSGYADTYGLTQRETWLVDYGDGKRISGKGKCSSQVGDSNNNTWTNPTISSTLPDSSGKYCYCQLDGYTTTGANWGAMESLSAPWVYLSAYRSASYCSMGCSLGCGQVLQPNPRTNFTWDPLAFRAVMFNSVQ